jgi:hypothetical protein
VALGKNTRHAPKRVAEMRDYWRIYRRNAILLSLLTQLLVVLVVGGALIVAGAHIDALPFIITMGATIITSVALNIYLILFLLAPLRDLATAIARAAGQTVDQPLGNPNLPRYAKDGFHDMLLYIYKNNSADNADTDDSHASQRYKTLLTALPCSKLAVTLNIRRSSSPMILFGTRSQVCWACTVLVSQAASQFVKSSGSSNNNSNLSAPSFVCLTGAARLANEISPAVFMTTMPVFV